MKTQTRKSFILCACLLAAFLLFTLLVRFVDVQPIGPLASSVGCATVNGFFHRLTGVHMILYLITDWASLIAVFIAMGFALLGLVQLISRRSLRRVDSSILVLGVFYILVFCLYLFFECFVVNSRPVLIDGILEASYPSSTTLLVLCFMPTAMMQFDRLIQNHTVKRIVCMLCGVFTVLMVLLRLISGVHWLTDILGGVLLSTALIMLYAGVNTWLDSKQCAPSSPKGKDMHRLLHAR